MGFMDDIISQQSGGGMIGGLPATWQYQNPETLTPIQKQMMGIVGTQNPRDVGFNPLPTAPGAFPVNGAAPIAGLPQAPTVAPPTFGGTPSPVLFANPPGSTPGNPALPNPVAAAGDDEEDDAPPAKLAAPIGVGSYQMPRIGPAAAFAPDPAALPVNAQPAQGQGLPGMPAPTQSVGDKLMTGYQNLHHGGGLIGSIVATITGKRNDPSGIAVEQQSQVANMTARALIGKGVAPEVAIAAVQPGNGEVLKELLKTAFAAGTHTQETDKDGNVWDVNKQTGQRTIALAAKDDKFTSVNTKNADGSESKSAFNTKTGEYTGSPSTGSLRAAIDPDSTGKERMDQLEKADPNYARKIKAMVNGDLPMPSAGQATRSPQAQRMIEDVLAVDGSTSASDFATRAATRKDYASGMASRVTKSLNTTIEHAQRLDDSIDKLGNHTYFPSLTNYLHDKHASNTDPEYQKAKSEFESNKEAFIKELDFTLSGGHSSVSGSAELRDKINRADSPEALHAAIKADLHLLSARLDSHTTGFNQGTRSQRDGQDFLYPKNRASFNKLMGSRDTSTGGDVPGVDNTAPAMSAPAAAPAIPSLKVGESAVIDGAKIKKVAD